MRERKRDRGGKEKDRNRDRVREKATEKKRERKIAVGYNLVITNLCLASPTVPETER